MFPNIHKKSSLELDGRQPAMPGTTKPESSVWFVKKWLKACLVLASWAIWVPKAPSHTNPTSRKLPTQKGGENNQWVLLVLLHFHSLGTKAVDRALCNMFYRVAVPPLHCASPLSASFHTPFLSCCP